MNIITQAVKKGGSAIIREKALFAICSVICLIGLNANNIFAQENSFRSVYASAKLGEFSDAAIKGKVLYLVGKNGMAVAFIGNPAKPRLIKTFISKLPFNDIAIEGNYAYVTVGKRWFPKGYLKIFDISNPLAINEIPNNLTLPEAPIGVTVKEGLAYVADYASGMIIVDVKNPIAPKIMSTFSKAKELNQEKYQKTLAFARNKPAEFKKLIMMKFKNLGLTPKTIDSWIQETGLEYLVKNLTYLNQYGYQGHVWYLVVRYPYAFVNYDEDGLYIVDISDPYKPVQVGYFNKKGSGGEPAFFNSCAVSGNYVYIGADYRGLFVVDISDVKNPREVAHLSPWADYVWYESPGHAFLTGIEGNLLYVTTAEDGMYIYDISDPKTPKISQKIDKTFERNHGMVWGFAVKDDILVLTYQKICGTSLDKKYRPKGGFEIFVRD